MITDTIRRAVEVVRANPDAITEIDKEEAEKAKAAKAEADRLQKAEARVAADLDDRTAALAADYYDLERQAVEDAARQLAAKQLRAEHGVTPRKQVAITPPPVRLHRAMIDAHLKRLIDVAPLDWDKQHRPGIEVRVAQAREASEALHPPRPTKPLTEESAAAAARAATDPQRAEAEKRRAAEIDARKKAAGIGPYAPGKAAKK